MVLSETDAEARLAELRRHREAIDRAITDLTLFLELGRRLSVDVSVPVSSPPSQALAEHTPVRPQAEPSATSASAAPVAVPRGREETREETVVPDHAAAVETGPNTGAGSGLAEGALARRYGRALVQAALSVLEEAGRPLHASEIVAGLAARGLTIPGQQDPVAALNTRLWKRSGPGGPIRRLGDAVYALPEGPGPA